MKIGMVLKIFFTPLYCGSYERIQYQQENKRMQFLSGENILIDQKFELFEKRNRKPTPTPKIQGVHCALLLHCKEYQIILCLLYVIPSSIYSWFIKLYSFFYTQDSIRERQHILNLILIFEKNKNKDFHFYVEELFSLESTLNSS